MLSSKNESAAPVSETLPATTILSLGRLSTGPRFHQLSNPHRNSLAAGARARCRRSTRRDRDRKSSSLKWRRTACVLSNSSSNCFPRRSGGFQCPVLRRAFPLANRRAAKRLQHFHADISWWNVERRWSRGLQDAISFTRVGDEQIAGSYDDPPMVCNKFWRPRVIPNGLLSGPRCFSKGRPPIAGIFPHGFYLLA
jgi:hypothetical protein